MKDEHTTNLLALLLDQQNGPIVERAQKILEKAGGLRGLLDMSLTAKQQAGLIPHEAVRLMASHEIFARYTTEVLTEQRLIDSPQAVKEILHLKMKGLAGEAFACLWLDKNWRLAAYEQFEGGVNTAVVKMKKLVLAASKQDAAAVILAHNPASKEAKATADVISATHQIRSALALIGVRVIDHIVVGNGFYSLSEGRLL